MTTQHTPDDKAAIAGYRLERYLAAQADYAPLLAAAEVVAMRFAMYAELDSWDVDDEAALVAIEEAIAQAKVPPTLCPRQCLSCKGLRPHRQSACQCTCWRMEPESRRSIWPKPTEKVREA